MLKWIAVTLRVTIAVLLLLLLVGEVAVVPAAADALARAVPRTAGLEIPLLALVDAVLLCVQVALVCTWVLLGMVERELIFAGAAALAWVDGIVAAAVLSTVLVGGAMWLTLDPAVEIPALSAGLVALALFGLGFTLLLVVMRSLLRQAAALRAELAEVV